MRNILLILCAISILFACKTPSAKTEAPQSTQPATTPAADATETESRAATTIENIGGYLGDETMFPFIYVESMNKLRFEAYTMKFSLEHPDNLIPLNNTDTPWMDAEKYTEFNGQFATYIRSGREAKLENPYIMVQYLNKNLPYVGTIDSIYMWLESRFLTEQIGGEIMQDIYEVNTQSGKKAICKEYRTPQTADGRAAKRMGYAYIDYNDTYIIGMNLTTLSESDYETSKPDFQKLIQSFNMAK